MTELHDRLQQLADTPMRSGAAEVFERSRHAAAGIRRRRTRRGLSALSAAAVIVVAAVGFTIQAQTAQHGLRVATRSSSTTANKPLLPQYQGDAMVLQAGAARPELCIDPVYSVQPAILRLGTTPKPSAPMCSGPPVAGWDWTTVAGVHTLGRTRWGNFHVIGTFEAGVLTLTHRPGPSHVRKPRPEQAPLPTTFRTPCATPPGGWKITNPARFSLAAWQAADALAHAQPDYAAEWTDNSTPVNGSVHLIPEQVLTYAFTGNPAVHRAQIEAVWGGPICVIQVARTRAELDRIQSAVRGAVGRRLGLDVLDVEPNEVQNRVEVRAVIATPELQRAVDDRFGAGAVYLTAALVPFP